MAQRFAEEVRADERFELMAPHPLSLVCFRLRGAGPESDAQNEESDAQNEALLAAVNATGDAFLTHTRLDSRYTLRLAIGAPSTRETHVAATWKAIQAAATRIQDGGPGRGDAPAPHRRSSGGSAPARS
jgi:aromatic-L-amino-acid decarboxylase